MYLDFQNSNLIEDFKALLVTENYLKKKNTLPTFDRLKEGVESITESSFTQSDLESIICVIENKFKLTWKNTSLDKDSRAQIRLCIYYIFNNRISNTFSISDEIDEFS